MADHLTNDAKLKLLKVYVLGSSGEKEIDSKVLGRYIEGRADGR